MFFYSEWDILYILVPILIGMITSASVRSAITKYSKVFSARRINAEDAVQIMLQRNGAPHVRVERIGGTLSDHFDPRCNTIRLSEGIYGSNSIAAIGVAAHEAGHASQHAHGYVPIKVRSAIAPAVNIASRIAFPLAIFGLFFELAGMAWRGAVCGSGTFYTYYAPGGT